MFLSPLIHVIPVIEFMIRHLNHITIKMSIHPDGDDYAEN